MGCCCRASEGPREPNFGGCVELSSAGLSYLPSFTYGRPSLRTAPVRREEDNASQA